MIKWILAALLFATPALSAERIVLNSKNTVNFRGTVDGDTITKAQMDLMDKVKYRAGRNYPIYLVFDSPGGSIYAGLAFIEFAKNIKNLHTISVFAASMASGIVEALPGKRYVVPNSIMMFHRAAGSFEGYFETGNVESELKLWQEIVLGMENTNASRLQISLAEYKQKVVVEWWMYGQGAIKDKAADAMASIVCTNELIDSREYVGQDSIFTRREAWSGCPLFRTPIPEKQD